MDEKVMKLEEDFRNNNSQGLFQNLHGLEGKPSKGLCTIKDSDEVTRISKGNELETWKMT